MLYIKAPAKINLALDIKYRRPDGYHEIDLIMQSITLADEIWISDSHQDVLICDHPLLPVKQENIVMKAVNQLREFTGVRKCLSIKINKKIPVAAGMAGGSTDAAAVLLGLNSFWNLGLPLNKLLELGLRLGADVPFCILKGTYRAQGIGEKLAKIASKLWRPLFLITPDFPLATADVYRGFENSSGIVRPNMDKVIRALETNNLNELCVYWGNILENSARNQCPPLEKVYSLLNKYELNNYLMSGSGPTFFLIDPPNEKIQKLQREIPKSWFSCYTEMLMEEAFQ